MKGDWVQAQYFISATQWSSQARSVGPLRYRRMDQVSPPPPPTGHIWEIQSAAKNQGTFLYIYYYTRTLGDWNHVVNNHCSEATVLFTSRYCNMQLPVFCLNCQLLVCCCTRKAACMHKDI